MNIVGVSFSYSNNSMAYRGLQLMDNFLNFSDLIKIDLPMCDSNSPDGTVPQCVKKFSNRLQNADILVFSIPEYTEHYSAGFKNAMDWLVVESNMNSSLGKNYSISDKPIYVCTFTPAKEGAGQRHFDITKKLLTKLGADIKACFVKNNGWDTIIPDNYQIIEKECNTILNTQLTTKTELAKADMTNQVPGWIEKYNNWNNLWK